MKNIRSLTDRELLLGKSERDKHEEILVQLSVLYGLVGTLWKEVYGEELTVKDIENLAALSRATFDQEKAKQLDEIKEEYIRRFGEKSLTMMKLFFGG